MKENGLQQVMLADENLLVLKSLKNGVNYSVQLIKANLNTGKLVQNAFHSNTRFSSNAAFRYNPADSSILLYSLVENTIFISKLDHLLNEVAPFTLLKKQFENDVLTNFVYVGGERGEWLTMHGSNSNYRSTAPPAYQPVDNWNYVTKDLNNLNYYPVQTYQGRNYRYTQQYNNRYANGAPIRFTTFSEELNLLKDSIVKNNKNFYTLQNNKHASVVMENKSYLLVGQEFAGKHQGILLVSVDGNDQVVTSDISVNGKFKYLLSNLKKVDNRYVILPYMDEAEVGLVKILINK
jgi:hypothetical protein